MFFLLDCIIIVLNDSLIKLNNWETVNLVQAGISTNASTFTGTFSYNDTLRLFHLILAVRFTSGQTLTAGTHICNGIPTKFVNQDYTYSNVLQFFTNSTGTELGGLKPISFRSGGSLVIRGNPSSGVIVIESEFLLPYPDFVV